MKLLSVLCLSTALLLPSFASADEVDSNNTIAMQEESMLLVHVNYDDAERMAELLDGIGAAKAQLIIDYRTEHGPFLQLEDLLNVKGIGEKTIEKNKDKISFDLANS